MFLLLYGHARSTFIPIQLQKSLDCPESYPALETSVINFRAIIITLTHLLRGILDPQDLCQPPAWCLAAQPQDSHPNNQCLSVHPLRPTCPTTIHHTLLSHPLCKITYHPICFSSCFSSLTTLGHQLTMHAILSQGSSTNSNHASTAAQKGSTGTQSPPQGHSQGQHPRRVKHHDHHHMEHNLLGIGSQFEIKK
jgi:hypothetical protein